MNTDRKPITSAEARMTLLTTIFRKSTDNLTDAYNLVVNGVYDLAVDNEPKFFSKSEYKELIFNGVFKNTAFPEILRYYVSLYCCGRCDEKIFWDTSKITAHEFKVILKTAVNKHIATASMADAHIGKTAEICAKMPINQPTTRNIRAMRTWCDNNGYEGEFGDLLVYQLGYLQGIQAERARRKERTE